MKTFKWSVKEPTHPTREERATISVTEEKKEKELVTKMNSSGPKFYFDFKSLVIVFCFSLLFFLITLDKMPQLIDQNYLLNLSIAYAFWVLAAVVILTFFPGLRESGFWKYIPSKAGLELEKQTHENKAG